MTLDSDGDDTAGRRFEAVLFDLLTGLLDSWSVWDAVAGSEATGRAWRHEYLALTYGCGSYRPYETLVAEAAEREGLPARFADELSARWDELEPWPEAPEVLRTIEGSAILGVVTNCSQELGQRAADRVGVSFATVVTAEAAGAYKPRPEPYRRALEQLGLPPERVLFVAGSSYDIQGATAVGMPVWWHNRIGMASASGPRAVAEHDSLRPLPRYLASAGD